MIQDSEYQYKKSKNYGTFSQIKINQLNKDLRKYSLLSSQKQVICRQSLSSIISQQMKEFFQKVKIAKGNLEKLNLIVGITGSGKSTLFNHLNGYPLKIEERIIEDENGNEQKTGIAILNIDQDQCHGDYAKISSTYVSETSIPNFCKSPNSDVVYVDCAGQFDNKDIVQSIINSFFKYTLASKAKYVKLTIVFNYNTLLNDRGSAFKKMLEQVGNFIGLWQEFEKSQSVSLVVSGAPRQANICEKILSQLNNMVKSVKDLGKFKYILQDIIRRKAIAAFLKPHLKVSNPEAVNNQEEEPKYIFGGSYEDEQKVGKQIISSSGIISKVLDKSKFTKCTQNLFVQNLQRNALQVINSITQDMFKKIEQKILLIMKQSIVKRSLKAENQQEFFKNQKIKLLKCKDLKQIYQAFQITQEIAKETQKQKSEFSLFQNISSVLNVQQKLFKSVEQLKLFFQQNINEIISADRKKRDKMILDMQEQIKLEQQQQKKLDKLNQEKLSQLGQKLLQAQENMKRKIEQEKERKRKEEKKKRKEKLQNDLKGKNKEDQNALKGKYQKEGNQKEKENEANDKKASLQQEKRQKLTIVNQLSGNWKSKIRVVNNTNLTFKRLYIKHGCNFSSKDNYQYLNPTVAKMGNFQPSHQRTFNMGFYKQGPGVFGNTAKMMFGFGLISKVGWGKDYWQIEGIVQKNGCQIYSTTKSDRYYTDVSEKDCQVTISISGHSGNLKVQFYMSSGSTSREFNISTSGNISETSWST